jgi:SAM-dependent methyltransferase
MTVNGSADPSYTYIGSELDLFALAANWKRYWTGQILPYLRGRVLEIGAGIGSNTIALADAAHDWTCLEPDAGLADRLRQRLAAAGLGFRVVHGTTADVPSGDRFDCALYIDVLEHIDDDRAELRRVSTLLRPGGRLIVLAPAHQYLFSPFDRAVGHCRRYSRATLLAAAPAGLSVERAVYLDSIGALASAANRFALRQSMPTAPQLKFWDRVLVPASRIVDPLLGYSLGKSVLAIWTKSEQRAERGVRLQPDVTRSA